MKKACVSFVSLAALFLIGAGAVLAQEETITIAPEETITTEDLGISDPGVLPTSPFYFFKEAGRGLQGFFTFNPVSKAELELKFANEKAAEVKKITETQPQNTEAIKKALENYQVSQERLRARFEKISETSQNPKVDSLLDKLTDRTVKHEKLFDEISFKFKERENIVKTIADAKIKSENVVGEASKKDDAAKFSSRLEKVLLEEKGGDLKHARSVELIDRFSGKAPEGVKESLERLREEFSERLKSDIEKLVEEKGEDVLREKITATPGDLAKRSVIIEEIQKKAEERLAEAIKKATGRLEEVIKNEADIAEKSKEQIERAEKIIMEAEEKIQKLDTAKAPEVSLNLLSEAKDHLKNAKSAFEQKKYGEAFGQARSAEVLARNALRFFEKERKPETENFEQHLKELEEKIHTYETLLKERGFTREQNKEAFELLDNAVLHLGYARDAFAKGNADSVKLHIGHIRGFLSKLSRLIEIRQIKSDEKPTILPQTNISPVPAARKIELEKTETQESTAPQPAIAKPVETAIGAAVREFKIEADDSGFYPSSVINAAKGSKVKITFIVREKNVYYGGLEMKSDVFKTGTIKPGSSATVEFTADRSFGFTSWWPLSNIQKSTGKVVVE